MNMAPPSPVALRLLRQLQVSPGSVMSALLWRGARKPWLHWQHGLVRSGPGRQARPALRPRLPWAEAILQTATPPSPEDAAMMMLAPAVLFGQCWSVAASRLGSIDHRFGIEAARLQHLQPLAALHWRSRNDALLAARLRQQLPEPLPRFLRRALRQSTGADDPAAGGAGLAAAEPAAGGGYPMDQGLRALSLLILFAALHGGQRADPRNRPADGDAIGDDDAPAGAAARAADEGAVAAAVARAVGTCLADPEYVGDLSNNHHLTNVACLLVMMSSLQPAGGGSESARRDPRIGQVWRWLQRAMVRQFDEDGAHFEYSSGYHMCALELLALAGLSLLDADAGASGPAAADADPIAATAEPRAERWRRLQSRRPPLAVALARALAFAQRLTRPDGSFCLIGDFDASRILRTHAAYHAAQPGASTTMHSARQGRVRRLRDPRDEAAPVVEAVALERADGDGAIRLVEALFDVASGPSPAGSSPAGSSPAGPAWNVADARPEAGRLKAGSRGWSITTAPAAEDLELLASRLGLLPGELRHAVCYRFDLAQAATWDEIHLSKSAGLVVGRGRLLMVTLRSGNPGQRGLGTHSHLDHLASDIWIDGGPGIADPGSWCYATSPALRNRYRDLGAHFTPLWQLDWSGALAHPFLLDRAPRPAALAHDAGACWGVLQLAGGWVARLVTLVGCELVIVDASSHHRLEPWPLGRQLPLADGYFGPLLPEDAAGRPSAPDR